VTDIEEAFQAGFAQGLGADLVPGTLSVYEEELAADLVKHKYGTDDWNFRR
jgi:lipoate-protein ligase A